MSLITDFTNYEIRKLDGFIVKFRTATRAGYYELKGFSLFDKASKSFVSLGSRCKLSGMTLPTLYERKKIWKEIMSGGFTDDRSLGFDLVPEHIVERH